MIPHHVSYQLAVVGLLWLCVMLHYVWPRPGWCPLGHQPNRRPLRANATVSMSPHPSRGLRNDLLAPRVTTTRIIPKRNNAAEQPTPVCHRHLEAFLPACRLGLPRVAGAWQPPRQWPSQRWPVATIYCRSCQGYFLEANGTIFHGKRLSVALIVRVLACLAEGLGIRATARVFEVDPNTVLQWLVEAAEQFQACTRYFLCDVHVDQLQLDELYAVWRGVKEGEVNEDDAILRLEGARPWVWTAIDPVSKLLLAMEVGPRGRGAAPGGIRHERCDCTGPSCLGLADQYIVCREAQSGPPPAGSGDRTPGQHAVPRRGQHAASTGGVPRLLQCRVASCELAPAVAGSRAHPRHGISEVVAAAHASDGGRTH